MIRVCLFIRFNCVNRVHGQPGWTIWGFAESPQTEENESSVLNSRGGAQKGNAPEVWVCKEFNRRVWTCRDDVNESISTTTSSSTSLRTPPPSRHEITRKWTGVLWSELRMVGSDLRFYVAYMKELSKTVNLTTRVLCSIVFRKPELIHLFPPSHLQFILQSGSESFGRMTTRFRRWWCLSSPRQLLQYAI